MRFVGATHRGKVRPRNEDSFLMDSLGHERWVFGVADGMGGHQFGDIASRLALEYSLKTLLNQKVTTPEDMAEVMAQANMAVYRYAEPHAAVGMGTTLTLAVVAVDRLLMGHIGDSRLYRFRDGVLSQLSIDHTLVAELVRQGSLSTREAKNHPQRHIVTKAVGIEPDTSAQVAEFVMLSGDKYLVCSDGLTELVEEREIANILAQPFVSHIPSQLIALALERGGYDNITVVIGTYTAPSATGLEGEIG